MALRTALLIDHPETVEPLAALFEQEWPDWYNPHGASARSDLSERARRDGLPLGIVALDGGTVVGTCALTASSGGLVTERSPWLGGLLVMPQQRRQGVATALLGRGRAEADRLGYRRLHALTAEADALFRREGWREIDAILLGGHAHRIYATVT
jgi:predicted N-acetyltransferase YhbS